MNKIIEIERLRGLAILMVMIGHIHYFHPFIPPYLRQTYTGVDLFFVISGFVVAYTYIKKLPPLSGDIFQRITLSLAPLRRFYLRRFFRIIPAALFWALVTLLFIAFFKDSKKNITGTFVFVQEFFSVLTFQYNYATIYKSIPSLLGPYWSLSVEEHFYFIFPVLLIIFSDNKKRFLAFVVLALSSLVIFRPFVHSTNTLVDTKEWLRYATHNRLDFLSAGVLLALLKINLGEELVKNWNIKTLIGMGLFLTGLLWIVAALFYSPEMINLSLLVILAICTSLVFIAMMEKNVLFNIPVMRELLEYLGSRSYSLYLIHVSTETMMKKIFSENNLLLGLVWLVATFILAELSYRIIELPLINYGQKNYP